MIFKQMDMRGIEISEQDVLDWLAEKAKTDPRFTGPWHILGIPDICPHTLDLTKHVVLVAKTHRDEVTGSD